MGGPGSTRWAMRITCDVTDGLPQFDVRALARAGALEPGRIARVTWGNQAAVTTVSAERPDQLLIRHAVEHRAWHGAEITNRVSLTTTPCNFGGRRAWFRCPGCGSRCAILYGVDGWFRCRGCHHLAYPSTRVSRAQRVGPGRSPDRPSGLASSGGTRR